MTVTGQPGAATAAGPGEFASVNPADPQDVVGVFPQSTPADVHKAVEKAAAAQRDWLRLSTNHRAALIGGVAHAIARETHEFIALITREEGKTTRDSAGEVQKSVEQFHFASQLAYQTEGTTFPDEIGGGFTYTVRQPMGVVAAITPWNFPLSLAARKLGPALASGNAVLFKPSPVVAAVGDAIQRVCLEAGLPDGLVQLIQGDDEDTMRALVTHPGVSAVTFTGSDGVGEWIRRTSRSGVRLQLELGGHNAAVVAADADVQAAAKAAAAGAFGLTGQACTATDRVLVHEAVYDEFRDAVAQSVEQLRVGPGTTDVDMGPVATERQHARLAALSQSVADAGNVVARAAVPDGAGWWVAPVLVEGLPLEHEANAAEIFGPVLSLVRVGSVEEAIGVINSSEHGLVSAIHTTNLRTAHTFAAAAATGIVKVNEKTTGNGVAPPFGGWKRSSFGTPPEGGEQVLEFFTQSKTVYCKL